MTDRQFLQNHLARLRALRSTLSPIDADTLIRDVKRQLGDLGNEIPDHAWSGTTCSLCGCGVLSTAAALPCQGVP